MRGLRGTTAVVILADCISAANGWSSIEAAGRRVMSSFGRRHFASNCQMCVTLSLGNAASCAVPIGVGIGLMKYIVGYYST